ncbi:MAG: hypothetical protein JO072_04805 [Parafilimonas sp.]|nr:hypothetical protein [Parafilimonas sp.]
MKSITILKYLLFISAVFTVLIFFIYHTSAWPLGLEALESLITFLSLIGFLISIQIFRNKLLTQENNISKGLLIGLLWTVEIGMNNIIQPRLPLRDHLDNIFWAIIAVLILFVSVQASYKTNKFSTGVFAGLFSGFASGAVACLTALTLILLGMHLLLTDAINIAEWKGLLNQEYYRNMSVYFAYQTMAGAIMHLIILGAVMGLLLGLIGGGIGKLSAHVRSKRNS